MTAATDNELSASNEHLSYRSASSRLTFRNGKCAPSIHRRLILETREKKVRKRVRERKGDGEKERERACVVEGDVGVGCLRSCLKGNSCVCCVAVSLR